MYQIYVRSFKDGIENDGIGDIKGIINKIEYLADLGVNVICLSSIYKSDKKKDLGYDVSDFKEIDEDYGTMKSFETLISIAEIKGIKVIIDFVPNHSSDDNPWFTGSNKDDFYVWKTATDADPLSNWVRFPYVQPSETPIIFFAVEYFPRKSLDGNFYHAQEILFTSV